MQKEINMGGLIFRIIIWILTLLLKTYLRLRIGKHIKRWGPIINEARKGLQKIRDLKVIRPSLYIIITLEPIQNIRKVIKATIEYRYTLVNITGKRIDSSEFNIEGWCDHLEKSKYFPEDAKILALDIDGHKVDQVDNFITSTKYEEYLCYPLSFSPNGEHAIRHICQSFYFKHDHYPFNSVYITRKTYITAKSKVKGLEIAAYAFNPQKKWETKKKNQWKINNIILPYQGGKVVWKPKN